MLWVISEGLKDFWSLSHFWIFDKRAASNTITRSSSSCRQDMVLATMDVSESVFESYERYAARRVWMKTKDVPNVLWACSDRYWDVLRKEDNCYGECGKPGDNRRSRLHGLNVIKDCVYSISDIYQCNDMQLQYKYGLRHTSTTAVINALHAQAQVHIGKFQPASGRLERSVAVRPFRVVDKLHEVKMEAPNAQSKVAIEAPNAQGKVVDAGAADFGPQTHGDQAAADSFWEPCKSALDAMETVVQSSEEGAAANTEAFLPCCAGDGAPRLRGKKKGVGKDSKSSVLRACVRCAARPLWV